MHVSRYFELNNGLRVMLISESTPAKDDNDDVEYDDDDDVDEDDDGDDDDAMDLDLEEDEVYSLVCASVHQ